MKRRSRLTATTPEPLEDSEKPEAVHEVPDYGERPGEGVARPRPRRPGRQGPSVLSMSTFPSAPSGQITVGADGSMSWTWVPTTGPSPDVNSLYQQLQADVDSESPSFSVYDHAHIDPEPTVGLFNEWVGRVQRFVNNEGPPAGPAPCDGVVCMFRDGSFTGEPLSEGVACQRETIFAGQDVRGVAVPRTFSSGYPRLIVID